ncbi:uncharacterized protein E0L32_000255 [Thyridium curvatum]|uniref:Zn(2)-C6 fungal-type domain-containing protein n=1 Tax=Thyridium curvatum TaxID=1093900 RepID=A0A507BG16_9PEZI|nr:uncharacterized protein E0L32_000255 [Thyridium curvatum]TPX15921.1 hypothetical protein E0L32_000255 [Thyridium curvatum]
MKLAPHHPHPIRKVKCDEAKPHCKRCTGTGRNCDGYAPPPEASAAAAAAGALTWHRPSPLAALYDDATAFDTSSSTARHRRAGEGRALHFFQEVVAPVLAGVYHHVGSDTDAYFWTALVLQFSHYEPAVRHAAVAVSALYEQFHQPPATTTMTTATLTRSPDTAATIRKRSDFALRHYNAAIRSLVEADNEALALVVCVIFVCIEFIRGDSGAATSHCRHGVQILNKVTARGAASLPSWAEAYLVPIIRRLSITPLFFGATPDSFPAVAGLDGDVPDRFESLPDMQQMLDKLMCRATRLIRTGWEYRIGSLIDVEVPREIIEEQAVLVDELGKWREAVAASDFSSKSSGRDTTATIMHLHMQCLIAKIWLSMAVSKDELGFDQFIPEFEEVVDIGTILEAWMREQLGAHTLWTRPKFTFEMGYLPLLYFVVIKCRRLDIRNRALILIRKMALERENLWDINNLCGAGKRSIELEHDIDLPDLEVDKIKLSELAHIDPGVAVPDDKRIRDAMILRQTRVYKDDGGGDFVGQNICFVLPNAGGGLHLKTEWCPIHLVDLKDK